MNSDCIVTQVHIPNYDVQGWLTANEKHKLVSFGLSHLRTFNPNACIILTGHGLRPDNLKCCDHVLWNDNNEPLNEHGYVIGMPAQYPYVSNGLEVAKDLGFKYCLKTRGDCLIGIQNINQDCYNTLQQQSKQLLITQQSGQERMGDCFMYGDLELLCKIWHRDNPMHNPDGLQNTAINFRAVLGRSHEAWKPLVKSVCAFEDVDKLKFMCLRWNFRQLDGLSDDIQHKLLDTNFNFSSYHWGKTNGWHYFDEQRNMTGSAAWLWSAKEFYSND